MRLLDDLNVAPRTVEFLRSLGHDVVRSDALLPGTASDAEIVETALREARTIRTHDLDFSALVALSGRSRPSVISLRLSSSRIERVNQRLQEVLVAIATELESGAIVSVEDGGVDVRRGRVVVRRGSRDRVARHPEHRGEQSESQPGANLVPSQTPSASAARSASSGRT